ncbi:MAG: helix-turn-helix domain-containing protein, partial [bacterium]|nr:helix-turn-helix domain-containing protein [bacterium]
MSNFVPLEEAAKKLGVSSEEVVEMISRREIFGYRDGTSWKFKPEEIQRVISEMMGDALDEDPAGSSILVS